MSTKLFIITSCILLVIIYKITTTNSVYDMPFFIWFIENFTTAKVTVNTFCLCVLFLPVIYFMSKTKENDKTIIILSIINTFIIILLLSTYLLYKNEMELKNICKTTINIHKNSPCQKWYKTGEIGKKIET